MPSTSAKQHRFMEPSRTRLSSRRRLASHSRLERISPLLTRQRASSNRSPMRTGRLRWRFMSGRSCSREDPASCIRAVARRASVQRSRRERLAGYVRSRRGEAASCRCPRRTRREPLRHRKQDRSRQTDRRRRSAGRRAVWGAFHAGPTGGGAVLLGNPGLVVEPDAFEMSLQRAGKLF